MLDLINPHFPYGKSIWQIDMLKMKNSYAIIGLPCWLGRLRGLSDDERSVVYCRDATSYFSDYLFLVLSVFARALYLSITNGYHSHKQISPRSMRGYLFMAVTA